MTTSLREEIRPIKGFDGLFVSNYGYVVSRRRKKPIIMKSHCNNGMRVIKVTESDGSTKNLWIHRVVAGAFLPTPSPGNKTLIHKDFDNNNNRSDNLEWVEGHVSVLDRVNALIQQESDRQKLELLERLTKYQEKATTYTYRGNPKPNRKVVLLSAIQGEINKLQGGSDE